MVYSELAEYIVAFVYNIHWNNLGVIALLKMY